MINRWYVAPVTNLLAFAPWNLKDYPGLSKYFDTQDTVVIGYLDGTEEIVTSTDLIQKASEKGVYTKSGTFYSFDNMFSIYSKFMNQMKTYDVGILYDWSYNKQEGKIIADVYENGEVSCDKVLWVSKLRRNDLDNDPYYCRTADKKTMIASMLSKRDLKAPRFGDYRQDEENIAPIEKASRQLSQNIPSAPDREAFEEAMKELDSLIGLANVKKEIRTLANLLFVKAMRKEKGLKNASVSMHMIFEGNPGTGKTTVARLVGKIFASIGILSKGHLVEKERSDIVAGVLGQSAINMREAFEEAVGGVLLIDEAYGLVTSEESDPFGKEVINTLVKLSEDLREDLINILTLYKEEKEKFLRQNPGLKSRFSRHINFEDYTAKEMVEIFKSMCKKNGYTFEDSMLEELEKRLQEVPEDFGNARGVRNLFEKAIEEHANRVSKITEASIEDLQLLTLEDIQNALKRMGL